VPTASARLRRKLALIEPAYDAPGRLLLERDGLAELYPRYQAATAHAMVAMIPLMQAALERARTLAPDDPVAAGLAEYLERHIPEELHGDEEGRAALDDLEALGIDTAAVLEARPPTSIAALIGSLAFWIWCRHPVAILGMLTLEGYQPHPPMIEEIIERTGLPRDGFRQLLLHSDVDVEHADELYRVIDSLPLSPEHEELIALSAFQTMSCLIDAWLDVLATETPVAVAP
jgi:hypothetical protein